MALTPSWFDQSLLCSWQTGCIHVELINSYAWMLLSHEKYKPSGPCWPRHELAPPMHDAGYLFLVVFLHSMGRITHWCETLLASMIRICM